MYQFEQLFYNLITKQPKHLTPLCKLVRLDRLCCMEMHSELSVNPSISFDTFIYLCTLIDYQYSEVSPEIVEFPEFKESLLYNSCISCDTIIDTLNDAKTLSLVLRYIDVRREVIESIQDLLIKKV